MGEAALIDTHVLLWLVSGTGPTSDVRALLADPAVPLLVSAVSAYELSLKFRLGKLAMVGPLLRSWNAVMDELGADALPVTHEHALVAGGLGWEHRDPFDRLLVAQARVEGVRLVTADRAVLGAAGVDLVAW